MGEILSTRKFFHSFLQSNSNHVTFLSLQRSQMLLSSCLMSGCVCYVDGNLPAEHNYGKFLELVIKWTELVTTGGFPSVASEPLSHSEETFSGKQSSFDSAYFVPKIS